MKRYVECVTIKNNGDEFYIVEPILDPTEEQINGLIEEAAKDYDRLARADKKDSCNEVRIYKLDEEAYDLSDRDELVSALCDSCGADEIPYSYGWEEFLTDEKKAEEDRFLEEQEEEFVLPLEKYTEGRDLPLADLVHVCYGNLIDLTNEDIDFVREIVDRILERHGVTWTEAADNDPNLFYEGAEIAGVRFARSYSDSAGAFWNEESWFSLCCPDFEPYPGEIPDVKLNMSKIKEARINAGLTQTAARDLIGVSKRTWEDWEHGRHTPPEYVERLIIEKLNSLKK